MAKLKRAKKYDANGVEIKPERKKAIRLKSADFSTDAAGNLLIKGEVPTLKFLTAAIKKIGIEEQFDKLLPLKSHEQIRLIVRNYYLMQKQRMRLGNQFAKLEEAGKESELIEELYEFFSAMEERIQNCMEAWNSHGSNRIANWLRSIHGIGPVLTAGWVSMIDINRASTGGAIMRYIGMDADMIWMTNELDLGVVLDQCLEARSQKKIDYLILCDMCNELSRKVGTCEKWLRETKGYEVLDNIKKVDIINCFKLCPYNQDGKQLAWKTWQSFHKQRASDKDYYGKLIDERVAYETVRNNNGEYAEQAKRIAERLKDKTSDTYKIYASGKLTDAHILNRAGRFCIKIFTSHFQAMYHWLEFGTMPLNPYVMEYMGHKDYYRIPNAEAYNFPEQYYKNAARVHPHIDSNLAAEIEAVKIQKKSELEGRRAERRSKTQKLPKE